MSCCISEAFHLLKRFMLLTISSNKPFFASTSLRTAMINGAFP
jgi:hypothetical protein